MRYLTAADIARRAQVEKSTVLRWIKNGKFENVRKVGNKYQVPLSEFMKWWEKNVKILHSTKK
jgi:excisionase family DNA binding protein